MATLQLVPNPEPETSSETTAETQPEVPVETRRWPRWAKITLSPDPDGRKKPMVLFFPNQKAEDEFVSNIVRGAKKTVKGIVLVKQTDKIVDKIEELVK